MDDNLYKIITGFLCLIGGYGVLIWGVIIESPYRGVLGLVSIGLGIILLLWGILSEIF